MDENKRMKLSEDIKSVTIASIPVLFAIACVVSWVL